MGLFNWNVARRLGPHEGSRFNLIFRFLVAAILLVKDKAQLLLRESVAMSEYQYYEFAAIEGPISDEGLRYARGCSSRANVSRVRWQNTYTFGDFHGSVDTLLKYYDAHFYIANWGTVRLGLAFPKGAIAADAIQPYLRGGERYEDTLTVKEVGNRCIVC